MKIIVLIEEFSLGLFPGFLSKYYELIKNEIIKKSVCLLQPHKTLLLFINLLKIKLMMSSSGMSQEPNVALFKFLEDENGKIDIIKIERTAETKSLVELLGNYAEGIDMYQIFQIYFQKMMIGLKQ